MRDRFVRFAVATLGRATLFLGTGATLFLGTGATLFLGTSNAQDAPTPTPPPPATAPYPAVPPTSPQAPAQVPSEPPYAGRPARNPAEPTATPAPPPAVLPANPTQAAPYTAMPPYAANGPYIPYGVPDEDRPHHAYGSAYIPVDSWIYPAMLRLYSLGFAGTEFLSMRAWTRESVTHILDECDDDIRESDSDEAKEILVAVRRQLQGEPIDDQGERGFLYGVDSAYTRVMGINNTTLRDSFHLGQTIINDYGRPYEPGFNLISGFSTLAERGRFSFFLRGEYEHSPSAPGYSQALAASLSYTDTVNSPYPQLNNLYNPNVHQDTIPAGPIAAVNPFRLQEASLSFYIAGHEISGGKTDAWLGPSLGGSLAWSNNAEDIYSFRINRVEPLQIPLLSRFLGPVRYDFMYGSLKGHTDPNHPYVHSEMFAFKPTPNFEFSFSRTIIFGGAGHEAVTFGHFIHGFFNLNDTTTAVKYSQEDPGARFSAFTAAYRLPYLRKYATFYVDSFSHDDVTPISAPRRAAIRTGLYLSQFPGLRKLDFRAEGAFTDPRVSRSVNGTFIYQESIQVQGYTNKGFIFGDWMGREAKGGQAWLTYNLSGDEHVQVAYLNKKNDGDFPGTIVNLYPETLQNTGTTQNQFKVDVMKRFAHNSIELNAWYQYERWAAPNLATGTQSDSVTAVRVTFFPTLKKDGHPLQ